MDSGFNLILDTISHRQSMVAPTRTWTLSIRTVNTSSQRIRRNRWFRKYSVQPWGSFNPSIFWPQLPIVVWEHWRGKHSMHSSERELEFLPINYPMRDRHFLHTIYLSSTTWNWFRWVFHWIGSVDELLFNTFSMFERSLFFLIFKIWGSLKTLFFGRRETWKKGSKYEIE